VHRLFECAVRNWRCENRRFHGPGKRVDDDDRVSLGRGVDGARDGLDGHVADDVGPVAGGAELVAGVGVGGLDTAAGKDVVELVEEQVLPCLVELVFGIGQRLKQPCGGGETFGGHEGMLNLPVEALYL